MVAFLNFSHSGRDNSEEAGGGNSFFPQPVIDVEADFGEFLK